MMLSSYIKRAKSGKAIVCHLLYLIACNVYVSSCEVISAVVSGEEHIVIHNVKVELRWTLSNQIE